MPDLFKEWLPSIMETKKSVIRDELDVKDYNAFMINRALSYHQDCLFLAAQMNLHADLPKDLQYQYYMASVIARRRPFTQWGKKGNTDDLKLLQLAFNYSEAKAQEALGILTEVQLQQLREKYQGV